MATLAQPSAERFHIVLPSAEKRRWGERASARGVNTSEYVRRAVAAYEDEDQLTGAEREILQLFLRELHTTAAEVHKAVEEVTAIIQRPYDEEAVREQVRAELEANPVHLDPAILDFGQVAR
jgi:hypothetical protein